MTFIYIYILIYVYAVVFMYFFVYIMIEAPTRPKIRNLVFTGGYNGI